VLKEEPGLLPLSVGTIYGGSLPTTGIWRSAISVISDQVQSGRAQVETPMTVNVLFQVPGHILQPDFEGIRTSSFIKRENGLIVQVALPSETPPNANRYVWEQLLEAVKLAEEWAQKKKKASDLHGLIEFVETLEPR